jgi:hypothetical protein
MTWMLVWYPCCKRRVRATQRSELMDYHCSHSHCIHYICDDCCCRSRQESQIIMELEGVDLVSTVCAALRQQACSSSCFDPILIDTYPALE